MLYLFHNKNLSLIHVICTVEYKKIEIIKSLIPIFQKMAACSVEPDNLSSLLRDPMFRQKISLFTKAPAGKKESFRWMFQKYEGQLSQKEWEKLNQFLNGEETEWMKKMLDEPVDEMLGETVHEPIVPNFSLDQPPVTSPNEKILRRLWLEHHIFHEKVIAYQKAGAMARAELLFGFDEFLQLLPPNEVQMFENFLGGEPHPCWMSDTPIVLFDATQYALSVRRGMETTVALMPLIYCSSCQQNCEAATKCKVSNKSHS